MRPAMLSGLISAGVPLATAADLADPRQLPEKFRQFITLAFELGAPLVPTLSQLEVQLRHEERSAQEVSQAQAVPQATRTLLLWLPLVAFLMSQIMGLASLKGLLHPVGSISALLAAALLGLGHKISGKMLATFHEMRPDPTRSLMVLRICLAAGEPLSKIEARLAKLDPSVATELIELSKQTGAKLAALIDSELEQLNQKLLSERIEAARRLSVKLLIPLSLTTLPAFLLLTLPPIIIGFTQ